MRTGRRGSTLLEFALVTPAFMLVMMTVLEAGLQLAADLALQLGAIAGSRYAVTGRAPQDGNRESGIRQAVLGAAGGLLKDPQLVITTASYASPASYAANFASGRGFAGGPGGTGQFVVYTLTYAQNYVSGLSSVAGKTSMTHTATVLVQNEPY